MGGACWQDKLGNMERELEWVRGELEEERATAARRGKDAAGRVREADSAAARLRSLHKEESKRLSREKQQLGERVQVVNLLHALPSPACMQGRNVEWSMLWVHAPGETSRTEN